LFLISFVENVCFHQATHDVKPLQKEATPSRMLQISISVLVTILFIALITSLFTTS